MRTHLIAMSIFLAPFSAIAQVDSTPVVLIPDGWKCVDKVAPNGQKYQICSPPSGGTGTPFFMWSKDPAPQAPAK